MDDTFDEWVRDDAGSPTVRKWATELIDLGTSWDSFRRDDASIVEDLVDAGGIPLLAARDIVNIAKEEIQRSQQPLAIFWDLENMPIPSTKSGREVTSRLKSILAPYGNLVQFRGYASIGLNLIPQQKRSDLQLSGCHLVDCPHNGRKEVADKMIIVDAMQFAFLNPTGATLCFITGDVDYAYTLAVLQRPAWRTIVISRGTISSMLHVNCDMRMRWETDILQLRPNNTTTNGSGGGTTAALVRGGRFSSSVVATPNNNNTNTNTTNSYLEEDDDDGMVIARKAFHSTRKSKNALLVEASAAKEENYKARVVSPPQDTTINTTSKSNIAHLTPLISQPQVSAATNNNNNNNNNNKLGLVKTNSGGSTNHSYNTSNTRSSQQHHQPRFEPLSPIEEWTDDVELLRSLLAANGNVCFKCTVGNLLRTTNPARFSNRLAVRNFLTQSIDAGVVMELGEGHYKELCLPDAAPTSSAKAWSHRRTAIPVSKAIPQEMISAVPGKVTQVSRRRPYILFVPKYYFGRGMAKPKGAFVKESRGRWLCLMFVQYLDVQRAVDDLPQLADCTLVDWRNCKTLDVGEVCGNCCRCKKDLLESEIIYKTNKSSSGGFTTNVFEELAFCMDCYEWNVRDGESQKAIDRVVGMLTMMADHDDVYVGRKYLKKQIYMRYTDTGVCTTHKHAELWIDEAIRLEAVAPFKKEGQKKILLCLSSNLQLANSENTTSGDEEMNTSKEEKFVESCLVLQDDTLCRWITRKSVNESLKAKFPTRMDSPFARAKVFHNGYALRRFCIARGPFGQTVGLTEQDAQESLELMTKSMKEELEWTFDNDGSHDEDDENTEEDDVRDDSSLSSALDEPAAEVVAHSDANAATIKTVVLQRGIADAVTVKAIVLLNDASEVAAVEESTPVTVVTDTAADADVVQATDNGVDDTAGLNDSVTPKPTVEEDEESEWDGESIDSAEIDALLFARSHTVE